MALTVRAERPNASGTLVGSGAPKNGFRIFDRVHEKVYL